MTILPYSRQFLDDDDIAAVVAVLRSDWLTQGPAVEQFEQAMAAYVGARFAVAVSSATAALHIACLAAGLGAGKRLWTSPNSFVASANCGAYCGAEVDFVDIDAADGNLSVAALDAKLASAAAPHVLVPVAFTGQSCDMAALADRAARYGMTIIEDASHAIGGSYGGAKVGACAHAAMTVFSFHPVKIITTGEGGLITTNDADLYAKLLRLRSHGITKDPALMPAADGPWSYAQVELGFNYRITDLQCALGLSQMAKLDNFVARRQYLARRYDEALAGLPLSPLIRHDDRFSALHLYVVRVQANARLDRAGLYAALAARDIRSQIHYIPIHTQPYWRQRGFAFGDFPAAEAHYRDSLSLPLYPGLSDAEQDRVVAALTEVLG